MKGTNAYEVFTAMLGVLIAPDHLQGADVWEAVERIKKKNSKEKEKYFKG